MLKRRGGLINPNYIELCCIWEEEQSVSTIFDSVVRIDKTSSRHSTRPGRKAYAFFHTIARDTLHSICQRLIRIPNCRCSAAVFLICVPMFWSPSNIAQFLSLFSLSAQDSTGGGVLV
ncbi:unnamed protein product [Protopolystoma xenopodis]|uniref:Uncharacterized protein n=1 Tax=Protopolystoma xenopodis TaxID=117903 RepID=A0A3S5CUJ9_9PLAT|nr:unnamed protein product [Protopolystoma xenopodis]